MTTQTKTTAAKQTNKATSKATSKATTATQWSVVAYIVAYIDTALADSKETYYHSARTNHKNTVFPRERNTATRLELLASKADGDAAHLRVKAVFTAHYKGILSSGNKDGQAVYDIYRMSK